MTAEQGQYIHNHTLQIHVFPGSLSLHPGCREKVSICIFSNDEKLTNHMYDLLKKKLLNGRYWKNLKEDGVFDRMTPATEAYSQQRWDCNTLQHTATHCNTLQHTATHRNTLQRTATHCNTLQHTATHCNTLQHTATHCNTLQHTVTRCNTRRHTATHCNLMP